MKTSLLQNRILLGIQVQDHSHGLPTDGIDVENAAAYGN